MMRSRARQVAYLAIALLASACSMKKSTVRDEVRYVQVDNQGYPDLNVYVVEGTRRIKLGLVTGNSTMKLALPRGMSRGTRVLRFVCDPVGGSRQSYTQDLTVAPGQDIRLTIRP
jgi:hypothetical protein